MERALLILESASDERLVVLASAGDDRAFAAIVARYRIVRHAFNGETHEDIAADLGVAPGAIRQLAYRARGALREAA